MECGRDVARAPRCSHGDAQYSDYRESTIQKRREAAALQISLPDNPPNYSGRPSVCRSCGALIGAGETSCHVCGAPLQPAAAPPLAAARALCNLSYARAVLSRPYIFTIVFLVAELLRLSADVARERDVLDRPVGRLSESRCCCCSLAPRRITTSDYEHECWRFVTPVFIHGNLPHLLMNMYSLWVIGPWVEKLYGSARFVVFWVVTGIAGVVASYLTVIPGARPGLFGSFLIKSLRTILRREHRARCLVWSACCSFSASSIGANYRKVSNARSARVCCR